MVSKHSSNHVIAHLNPQDRVWTHQHGPPGPPGSGPWPPLPPCFFVFSCPSITPSAPVMQSHLVRRWEGQTHGHKCKGRFEPRVETSVANPTGTVFLHCTHCNSESCGGTFLCLLSLGREGQLQTTGCGTESLFPTPTQRTADDQGSQLGQQGPNMKGHRKPHGGGEGGEGEN